MRAHDLYRQYRSLNVDLVDGTMIFGLDVHEYRNNALTGDLGASAGLTEAFAALAAKVRETGKKIGTGTYQIALPADKSLQYCPLYPKVERVRLSPDLQRPYVGKGSPDEIRQALRLAVFFGLLPATKNALQNYCDQYIGLDCSGFAANFYGTPWVGKNAAAFLAGGIVVPKLEQIRSGHALLWSSGKHIAVIDRVDGDGRFQALRCMVVEATGDQMIKDGPADGLFYTEYMLEPASGDQVVVYRPLAKTKTGFYSPSIKVMSFA